MGQATNFSAYEMDDIGDRLAAHISGWKTMRGIPMPSHFVSTTDSFESALNRAERSLAMKRTNIFIYVIDTHTLRQPSLVLLMYLAVKAYDVASRLAPWRNEMFRYGSLTEWIWWDTIAATCVDKIDYLAFSKPERGLQAWRKHLSEIVPDVVEAGHGKKNSPRGVPRTVLHATLYTSKSVETARLHYDLTVWQGRCGPLPNLPKEVTSDKRVLMEEGDIEHVWSLASVTGSRNLVFMWLLSLMTQRYYIESIVEQVVKYHPEVVTGNLQRLCAENIDDASDVLVYYMPGPHCFGRVDVNQYRKLMQACISRWDALRRTDVGNELHDLDIYIVTGPLRPLRNLLRPKQFKLFGRCLVESVLEAGSTEVSQLTVEIVRKVGVKMVQPESDEQHRARLRDEYGNIFYLPTEKPLYRTQRPNTYNSAFMRTTPVQTTPNFPREINVPRTLHPRGEARLRQVQLDPPPVVGAQLTGPALNLAVTNENDSQKK